MSQSTYYQRPGSDKNPNQSRKASDSIKSNSRNNKPTYYQKPESKSNPNQSRKSGNSLKNNLWNRMPKWAKISAGVLGGLIVIGIAGGSSDNQVENNNPTVMESEVEESNFVVNDTSAGNVDRSIGEIYDNSEEDENTKKKQKVEEEREAAKAKKAEEDKKAAEEKKNLEEKKAEEERAAAAKKAEAEIAATQTNETQDSAQPVVIPDQSSNSGGVKSGNGDNFDTYNIAEQQNTTESYVLNTKSKKIHYPSCKDVPKISPENYATSSSSRADLISQGYTPCGHCNP